ncbi:thioredoxin family protein [Olivibacter sitiensis]|uniref:thioredoxin family protein n=1 Tax=Olivibacter sitiensis TaxID=376470 RepID=UPI00055B4160|nr:thioredoxin family protein [Olivibacter sitiensis]
MKQISIICLFFLFCAGASAQETKAELYHPEADAKADIENAVQKAGREGKHVFLQIGGNWCSWCLAFNGLVTSNDTLRNYIAENYEVVHVNYSKENKNEAVLASLGYPQRFGFPVFVILDGQGNRLHTQNSAYLEEGKGHSAKEVLSFLKAWSPSALDPKSYQ